MVVVLSLLVVLATGIALNLWLQLYMMRLRARYWENQTRSDSLIRHQWLHQLEPQWSWPRMRSES